MGMCQSLRDVSIIGSETIRAVSQMEHSPESAQSFP